MYDQILVAVDRTEIGKNVFATALSLAQQNKSSLILLHVLSTEEDFSPMRIPSGALEMYPALENDLTLENWRSQWELFEREGLELLRSLEEQARKTGVSVVVQQVFGSPARIICQQASDRQVDLVVVGRRGRTGLSELILGSVSNYVLHHAPCSVLVVQ
jgi:nucleotide-binding universal stress UspA family protein